MKTSILIPANGEPLTLAEVKAFLKITHTQEDELLPHLISTARQISETYTRRKWMTQRLVSVLPFHPNHQKKKGLQRVWTVCDRYALFLPRGPVINVLEVERISDNAEATVISHRGYHVNSHQEPVLLVIEDKRGWGVRVTYDVGYGPTAEDVPPAVRQALRQMVAHMYENRTVLETHLLQAVGGLLNPYRLQGGVL